ncbi:MAG TPA: alpha/beta fold hydrolase [Acidimicrobiales bacterium]|nr:alpha/beta fold hydrolase [Acidimicrobiales bacterium]
MGPPLPPGGPIELPGRGTTFHRDARSRAGADAPVVLLLHGWTATADLNWFPSYGPLAGHARVLAIDHRGHGGGIRSGRRFRLADCADDAVALADVLGVERFIPVGYSMGGLVAQLLWHRHPDRVDGLVLAATARNFRGSRAAAGSFAALGAMAAAARVAPPWVRAGAVRRLAERRPGISDWAREQFTAGDPRMVLEAGQAIGNFSSHEWIGGVDVPTAVVLTEHDRVVPPARQRKLADAIPGAVVHQAPIDHGGCVAEAARFVPVLVGAVQDVARRRTVSPA